MLLLKLVFVVAAVVAAVSSLEVLPGYPYTLTHPLVYNYQPVVTKVVPKEVEIEVKSYQVGMLFGLYQDQDGPQWVVLLLISG